MKDDDKREGRGGKKANVELGTDYSAGDFGHRIPSDWIDFLDTPTRDQKSRGEGQGPEGDVAEVGHGTEDGTPTSYGTITGSDTQGEGGSEGGEQGEEEEYRTDELTNEFDSGEYFGPGYYTFGPQRGMPKDVCYPPGVGENRETEGETGTDEDGRGRAPTTEFGVSDSIYRVSEEADWQEEISEIIDMNELIAPTTCKAIRRKRRITKKMQRTNDAIESLLRDLGIIV